MSAFGQPDPQVPRAALGKIPNFRSSSLQSLTFASSYALRNKSFFDLARPVHCYRHGPNGGLERKHAKGLPMFTSLSSVRETATLFAGAFISALLLVSAATSLPIA
jgi:hypothetical protein